MDDIIVSKSFLCVCVCARSVPSETFLKSFQFKILSDILFTNHRLAKIGYVPNDLCTFCGSELETINHLFYECSFASQLWKEFETFWSLLSRKRVDLTLQDVL